MGYDGIKTALAADQWRPGQCDRCPCFERGAPAYCVPLTRVELEKALAEALREAGPVVG